MTERTISADTARGADVHAHYYPLSYLQVFNEEGKRFGGEYRPGSDGFHISVGTGRSQQPYSIKFTDLEQRIADMDAQGIAVQALSLTAPMVDWGDAELSQLLARRWNDAASAAHRAYPTRLVGLAALPMRDPDRAIDELDRARNLPGIRGVYIGTHVGSRALDDPRFGPIWARIEAVDLPVFLHPVGPTSSRLHKYDLWNLVGFPVDGTTAACHLIFGGVLDRHPALRICLPHAGGVLPLVAGRLDHGWRTRADLMPRCEQPSSYLARFYYDTVAHSARGLQFLIDHVGAGRLMLGSDYCFPMGDTRPVQAIEALNLEPAQREMIVRGTAAALLGL